MKLLKLALVFEQDHLLVSVWAFGLKGWKIARSEKVALPTADPLVEQGVNAIRPLTLKWGLPPDVPVMAVTPDGVGGVLSFSFPRAAKKDLETLIDFELGKALPFSLKEVERDYQARRVGNQLEVSVFWVPKSWVTEFKNALARGGFRLSELFHRAQLMGVALSGGNESGPWGCIEQNGQTARLHFYRRGAQPDRSRRLDAVDAEKLRQELDLDLVALSCANLTPAVIYSVGVESDMRAALAQSKAAKLQPAEQKINLPELLLSLWNGGGNGVWLMPDKRVMAAKLTPVMIGMVMTGIVLSSAAWWATSRQGDNVNTLEGEVKKLKPRYQKALSVERDALRAQQELNTIAATLAGPSPLEPFYGVFKALPEEAWLVAFDYSAGQVEIEGYGIGNAELSEKLKESGKFKGISPVEPQLARDEKRQPFALRMSWVGGAK